ncbi:ferric reductase-like transmembrane domain-containing protein [Desulforhopalus singaporensis]|uniref:ferric reductase-like transmembrane domain-containing protein n=1 Tax=Desulforhopalus singaporensis TaxID=91360 RepID=UPI000B86A285|nr:ferric reductase-like transmembrane domain-containing protein [Desulforhopalus singaporensis]
MKKYLLVSGCLGVFAAAMTVPFVYETKTLWYKIGFDRTLLRAGQLCGLVTFLLLLVQVLLANRGRLLEQSFGVPKLLEYHRKNGVLIGLFALLHLLGVLIPENLGNLPLSMRFWPELVGAGLFLLIALMAVTSRYRLQLGLDYPKWRYSHRIFGYLAIGLASLHVLFVSESFSGWLPRLALIGLVGGCVVRVVLLKWFRTK